MQIIPDIRLARKLLWLFVRAPCLQHEAELDAQQRRVRAWRAVFVLPIGALSSQLSRFYLPASRLPYGTSRVGGEQ